MSFNQRVNGLSQILHSRNLEVCARQDLIATHVNNFALLVHYFVVLQDVLTNLTVALFNSCLCTLDGFGDHLCFNGFVVRQCATHDPTKSTSSE